MNPGAKVWVCRECLVALLLGVPEALEESQVWDSAWNSERYLANSVGLGFDYDIDPDTEDGIDTFSRSACELCDSRQAGERFRFAVGS